MSDLLWRAFKGSSLFAYLQREPKPAYTGNEREKVLERIVAYIDILNRNPLETGLALNRLIQFQLILDALIFSIYSSAPKQKKVDIWEHVMAFKEVTQIKDPFNYICGLFDEIHKIDHPIRNKIFLMGTVGEYSHIQDAVGQYSWCEPI